MIVAFSVSPAAGDEDGGVSAAVARALQVVRDSGLRYELNSMFTNVEGGWDEVMDVVKRATEAAGEGAPRVSLVIKADIRPGRESGQLAGKVERVRRRLDG